MTILTGRMQVTVQVETTWVTEVCSRRHVYQYACYGRSLDVSTGTPFVCALGVLLALAEHSESCLCPAR